ncbi:hypothetical protein AVEN_260749-1 [Araneus ventricosus]|uniref:Uncharacterized protein n=1 Tax=Araneus ventricosus TaxID=182803 RepID=A0A4Y2LFY7_ARAVE|nr:hypothetical protein AVEN_260749-1 [Araneus ventricosus]
MGSTNDVEKPICWPLEEVELKGKFGQLKTKATVVCRKADKRKYLLRNRTAALLGEDRERLLFPKAYILQTRAYKRLAEQKSYVSTPRNSDVTAKTNETVNQLKIINEKKRIQRSKFSDEQSPATSTCTSVNDTKIKSVTKISKRPNKYRFPVNAIEKSHFLHSEVILEEKGNEALDIISLVKCQESGNKAFSIKTVSDINQEIVEDVEFGSETEKENQTSFRENKLTEEDELISDYEIPITHFTIFTFCALTFTM